MKRSKLFAAALLPLLLSGCVFYPQPIQHYDDGCEIIAKRLTLGVMDLSQSEQNCPVNNEACLAVLLGVTAGSAIVSGSIVIVGNTVY